MPNNVLTATNLASGADGFGNNKPILSAFTPIWINTWVLDNGLTGLKNNADSIYLCSQQPVDFTTATVTYGLGSHSFGVGSVFGAPANGAPNGRVVTSGAITNGNITANGTPTYWAAVDTANSRLLATGPLSGGGPITSGNQFTLSAVSVHIPSQTGVTLLPNFQAAVIRSRAGGVPARILVDAHSYGAGGGITGTNQVSLAYGELLRTYLPAQGISTLWNAIVGDYNSVGVSGLPASTFDTRIAIGSGWGLIGNWILGGKMMDGTAGATGTYDFTPGFTFNHVRFWVDYDVPSQIKAFVDGTLISTGFTESGPNGPGGACFYMDMTGVSGAKVSLQPPAINDIYLNAIECFSSVQTDAVLAVSGNSGAAMARLADVSQDWSAGFAAPFWHPDLVILDCMANDVIAGTDPTAFQVSTQSIVSSMPNSDIILFIDPVGNSTGNYTNGVYDTLVTAIKNVASLNSNCVVFDSRTVMGLTFNASLMNADGIHPNNAGHVAISQGLALQIRHWMSL
jgi:hypothetical protein